jgi:hypothetical protein
MLPVRRTRVLTGVALLPDADIMPVSLSRLLELTLC